MIVQWLTLAALAALVVIGFVALAFLRETRDELKTANNWLSKIRLAG